MAEQISLICPECSTKLRLNVAGQDLTGKQVKCPKCSKRFAADQALSEPEAPLIHSSDAFEEERPVLGTAAAKRRAAQLGRSRFEISPDDNGAYGGSFKPRSSSSGGGFIAWLGFGVIAGLVCAAITAAAGFAHSSILISVLAVVAGIAVGGAVRNAGGSECGAGSAVLAAMIAVAFMFAGKVGAFYVSPELSDIGEFAADMKPMSLEETQAMIEAKSSEDSMIAAIATELEADAEWLKEREITDEMITAHWEETPDDEQETPAASQYLPKIWEAATARWNENSDAQKQTLISAKQTELRADYGMMTEDEVREEIAKATTDAEMIAQIGWEVSYDEDWLTENDLTEEELEDQIDYGDENEPAEIFPPVVWEEATRRWNELTAPEKKAQLDDVAEAVRMENTYSEEEAQMENAVVGFFRLVFIVFAAIGHFFAPMESLICTVIGLLAAIGLGSGFPATK